MLLRVGDRSIILAAIPLLHADLLLLFLSEPVLQGALGPSDPTSGPSSSSAYCSSSSSCYAPSGPSNTFKNFLNKHRRKGRTRRRGTPAGSAPNSKRKGNSVLLCF